MTSPGIYKVTVTVEVPVLIREGSVPEGTTWAQLHEAAARHVEGMLFPAVREVASIAVQRGSGSGFFPDGTEHDGKTATGRVPIRGLTLRVPGLRA